MILTTITICFHQEPWDSNHWFMESSRLGSDHAGLSFVSSCDWLKMTHQQTHRVWTHSTVWTILPCEAGTRSKAILSGRTALLIRGTSVFSKDSLVGFVQGLLGECSRGFCVSYDVLQPKGGSSGKQSVSSGSLGTWPGCAYHTHWPGDGH